MCRGKPGFKGLPRNQMETENPRGVHTRHSCLLFFCRVCQGDEWAQRGNRAGAGLAAEGCRVSPSPLHLRVGVPRLWLGALGVGEEKVDERPQFSLLGGLSSPSATCSLGLIVGPLLGALGAVRDPEWGKLSLQALLGEAEGGAASTLGLIWGFDVFTVEVESKQSLNW